MSEENVEIVKTIFRAWEDRDPQAAFSRIDPNVEVDLRGTVWGQPGVAHGHGALQQAVAGMLSAWQALEFFPDAFIDAGDDVIVWLRITARGRGSGVPTERHGASVYTVRDGIVTRWTAFETLSEAAKAVGI